MDDDPSASERLVVLMKRTGCAAAFFGAVHFAASYAVPRILGRELVDRALAHHPNPAKRRANRRYLAEMVGSWIHAGFVGGSSLYLAATGAWATDVFDTYPDLLHAMFAATAGWSLWDMGVMMGCGEKPSMWVHHAITFLGTTLMQLYRTAAFFPAITLLTELTVLPANVHWYMGVLRLKERHKGLYFANLVVRAAFHVLFRLFTCPGSIAWAIHVHGAAEFWRKWRALPLVVSGASTFNLLFLSYMNVIWTRSTFRAIQRWLKEQRAKAQ